MLYYEDEFILVDNVESSLLIPQPQKIPVIAIPNIETNDVITAILCIVSKNPINLNNSMLMSITITNRIIVKIAVIQPIIYIIYYIIYNEII
jgi:hypothetical protein